MSNTIRERIFDETMYLFSENSYSGTSITKIEAAAGLTPLTVRESELLRIPDQVDDEVLFHTWVLMMTTALTKPTP